MLSPLHSRSPFRKGLLCIHKVFTNRSTFTYCSVRFIIFKLIIIHTCSFFCYFCLITVETLCKGNSRSTPNKSFILRSHAWRKISYIAFAFALCLRSAFTHHSPFINTRQICSACAHSVQRVRSPFTHHSLTI